MEHHTRSLTGAGEGVRIKAVITGIKKKCLKPDSQPHSKMSAGKLCQMTGAPYENEGP